MLILQTVAGSTDYLHLPHGSRDAHGRQAPLLPSGSGRTGAPRGWWWRSWCPRCQSCQRPQPRPRYRGCAPYWGSWSAGRYLRFQRRILSRWSPEKWFQSTILIDFSQIILTPTHMNGSKYHTWVYNHHCGPYNRKMGLQLRKLLFPQKKATHDSGCKLKCVWSVSIEN